MHYFRVALLALLLAASSRLLHAAEIPAVEAFGSVPQITHVSMSPDGALVAWHDQRDGKPKVVLFDLETRKYKRVMPLKEDLTVQSLGWTDSKTLLATLSYLETFDRSRTENFSQVFRTQALNVDTGEEHTLLMGDAEKNLTQAERAFVLGASMLARRAAKPNTVVMSRFGYLASAEYSKQPILGVPGARRLDGWVSQVFEVDTRTGKGTRVEAGSYSTSRWMVNREGNIVARAERQPGSDDLKILVKDGAKWRELAGAGARGSLVGLSGDGRALLVRVIAASGRVSLVAIPLDGSKESSLVEDPVLDVDYIVSDPATGAPVGAHMGGPEEPIRWFDPDADRLHKAAAAAFPGREVRIRGRSDDNRRAVVEVWGPSTPSSFYVIDFGTHKAESIGDAYPAFAGRTLAPVQMLSYKARDGADVPAYLTLPSSTSAGALPLVVLPHDGPDDRDSYTFDWLAQFLAAQGYAVLQSQFRGSTGFGEAWRDAGDKQWGKLMQDDLTDGVKALVDRGIADARRVCIAGIGYGGFAALAGAAFTPTTYRCAVSINGISDLPGMLHYADAQYPGSRIAENWKTSIGAATEPQVLERSPRTGALAIRIPVLLLHGKNDIDIPLSQSRTMARILKDYGKTATFIEVENADHSLTRSAARQRVLAELGRFLEANLRQ